MLEVAWDRFALAAAAIGVMDYATAMLHKANVVEVRAAAVHAWRVALPWVLTGSGERCSWGAPASAIAGCAVRRGSTEALGGPQRQAR